MSITDNVQKTAKTARCGLLDRAVKPGDIIVGDRLRALDRESVERLKESISRIGLKTPISVRLNEQGWTLVSGRHRLKPASSSGWTRSRLLRKWVQNSTLDFGRSRRIFIAPN
jgi:ParB-like chromosome segregation protein Spo0J